MLLIYFEKIITMADKIVGNVQNAIMAVLRNIVLFRRRIIFSDFVMKTFFLFRRLLLAFDMTRSSAFGFMRRDFFPRFDPLLFQPPFTLGHRFEFLAHDYSLLS